MKQCNFYQIYQKGTNLNIKSLKDLKIVHKQLVY